MSNNLHLDGDFTLNMPEFEAEFTANEQPDIEAQLKIGIAPEKVSELENDLNFQTEAQVQEAIQAESTVINGRIDDEVARLEDEIEQSATTIVGSDLIWVETQNQTVTITSKTFVFEQGIPSTVWVINHNLNKRPSVDLAYYNGEMFQGYREYPSDNQVIVTLDAPTTGYAYLN